MLTYFSVFLFFLYSPDFFRQDMYWKLIIGVQNRKTWIVKEQTNSHSRKFMSSKFSRLWNSWKKVFAIINDDNDDYSLTRLSKDARACREVKISVVNIRKI